MTFDPAIAAAADYADALIVLRRAKKTLILVLILMLVAQIALFSAAKFLQLTPAKPTTLDVSVVNATVTLPATVPTTAPARAAIEKVTTPEQRTLLLTYATTLTLYVGMLASLALPLALLLIAGVMLVGRLIGMAPVVKALVLSIIVALLVFPWQTMLNADQQNGADFVLPGVFYTWREITARAGSTPAGLTEQILYWSRFYVWPVVTIGLLLSIQLRSGRGLRMALGEVREVAPPV
ncbi:MAG: hypothetical protein QM770_07765 [Tepidisphaeraceae bacterium]